MSRGMGRMDSSREQTAGKSLDLKLVIRSMWPLLREHKSRIFWALSCLMVAKGATVVMPLLLKHIIDDLDTAQSQMIAVPLALLFAYGFVRFATVLFSELRDSLFGRVTERAMRKIALQAFEHLHALDLNFHLSRQTGGISRDIERGTTGISTLMRFMVFNIVPTFIEIFMVAAILTAFFSWIYALITVVAVAFFMLFTVITTEWRTRFVREAHQADSASNSRAIDSLLNYETVKYFNNEAYEAQRYDENLAQWEAARGKNRLSLALLNSGQALIVSIAVMSVMILAAYQVVEGELTLGDLVMINAYMIQLFIPLNFLGFVYREIRRALTEIENLFRLTKQVPAIVDAKDALPLRLSAGEVEFRNVHFAYQAERGILHGVNFTIRAGQKIGVVGSSGSGKSTIARLMFRFYDAQQGQILFDGQDIRHVTQLSLRDQIGVVPQDTVLFNDTIKNNIAYGRPDATDDELLKVIKMAKLDAFIDALPQGWQTTVGERGLKVSGGEKQRIAIARVLLKNPPILIFDEATSALDSDSEKTVVESMNALAKNHTSLVIAHRLSTVIDADFILVLEQGHIIEAGTHAELLQKAGRYAEMWRLQQSEKE